MTRQITTIGLYMAYIQHPIGTAALRTDYKSWMELFGYVLLTGVVVYHN